MQAESFSLPTNNNDRRMQEETYYHVGPETPTGCLIVLDAPCLLAKQSAKWAAEGRKIQGGIVLSLARCESTLKCFSKNISCSMAESRSTLIVSAEGSGRLISITQRPQILFSFLFLFVFPMQLTVKTAFPGVFGHAAAHRLVPLRHVARAAVHTVVVADPPLAEGPREPDGAAAGGLTWVERGSRRG